MSLSNQRELIEQELAAQFPLFYPDVVITWENVPPGTLDGVTWIRCQLLPANTRPACINGENSNWRYTTVVSIEIFVPLSEGTALLTAIADQVIAIFRNADIPPIRFQEFNPVPAFQVEGWYKMTVFGDFLADYNQ